MKKNQILSIYGKDYCRMTQELLRAADLQALIGGREKTILLKPNLVLASTAESGAVTHPEILEGVIVYLKSEGFTNLRVCEGSWVGAKTVPAARLSGILGVCEAYGVPFVDLQKDESRPMNGGGMTIRVCEQALNADFIINLPVVKGHCQTLMTCALKNLKGLLPNSEKRRFHTLGLHRPIACLNTILKPGFIVADNICGDLNFEEGGTPVQMDRIFCCTDPVLCDSFACQTMGVALRDVPYIRMAEQLGVGCADLSRAEILALNEAEAAIPVRREYRVRALEAYAAPKDACSACYGMLIHALDKLEQKDLLRGLPQPVCIGQGYRAQSGELGVGSCTKNFRCNLPGCPPTAEQMLRFLEEQCRR